MSPDCRLKARTTPHVEGALKPRQTQPGKVKRGKYSIETREINPQNPHTVQKTLTPLSGNSLSSSVTQQNPQSRTSTSVQTRTPGPTSNTNLEHQPHRAEHQSRTPIPNTNLAHQPHWARTPIQNNNPEHQSRTPTALGPNTNPEQQQHTTSNRTRGTPTENPRFETLHPLPSVLITYF